MTTVRRSGRVVILIASALSLIAAACTNGGSSFAPTTLASVSPSATPSASTSTPPLVQEGGAPMEPGTYTTVFQPKITFTTDASWVSYADSPGFVQFERADGNGAIDFKRIDKVFDPANDHHLLLAPKDYVAWITSLPGVKVLAGPKDVTVAGIKGSEIDVTATEDAPTLYCKDPCVAIWSLGPGEEPAALRPGFVSRMVALRLDGGTVSLDCGAPTAEFKVVATDFDAMLATVRFG
jgi:hypothetical protein